MVLLHEAGGMPYARRTLLLACFIVTSHSIPLLSRPLPSVTEKIVSLPSISEISPNASGKLSKLSQAIKAIGKARLKDRSVKAIQSMASTLPNHQETLPAFPEGTRLYEELAAEPTARGQKQRNDFITERIGRQVIERQGKHTTPSTGHASPISESSSQQSKNSIPAQFSTLLPYGSTKNVFEFAEQKHPFAEDEGRVHSSIEEDFTTYFEQKQKTSIASEIQHIESARLPSKLSPTHRSGRKHFPKAVKNLTPQFRKAPFTDLYNVLNTPATQMADGRFPTPADLLDSAALEADRQERETSTVATESQIMLVDLRHQGGDIAPTSPADDSYDGATTATPWNSEVRSFSPVNFDAEVLVDDTENIFESLKFLKQVADTLEDQNKGMVSPTPYFIQHRTDAVELKAMRRSFFFRDWRIMATSVIVLEVSTICLLILSSKLRRCRRHSKMNNMKKKQSKFGYGYEFKSLEDVNLSISNENQDKGAIRAKGNHSSVSKSKANSKQGNIYTEPPMASAFQKKNDLQSLQAEEPLYVDVGAWQKVLQPMRMKESNLVDANEYNKVNKDLSCKASTQEQSAVQEPIYLSIEDVTKPQNPDKDVNFEIRESLHDTKDQPLANGRIAGSRGEEGGSRQLGADRSSVAVKSQSFVEQGDSSVTSGVRIYISSTTECGNGANVKADISVSNSSSSTGRDGKLDEQSDVRNHANDDMPESSSSAQEPNQDVGGEKKVGKVWDKYKYFFEAERQFRSYGNASASGSKAPGFSTWPVSTQQPSDWKDGRKRKRVPGMSEEDRMVLRKHPRLQTVATPPPQQSDTLRTTYLSKEKGTPQHSTSGSSLEIVNMGSHERLSASSKCLTDPVSRIDLCQAERVPSESTQSQLVKNLEPQFLPGDTANGVAGTRVRKVRRRIDKKNTGEKWL